jgi:hypothetical protein
VAEFVEMCAPFIAEGVLFIERVGDNYE